MEVENYCVLCKWHIGYGDVHLCQHIHIAAIDVVTGRHKVISCKDARDHNGKCGPLGDKFHNTFAGVRR